MTDEIKLSPVLQELLKKTVGFDPKFVRKSRFEFRRNCLFGFSRDMEELVRSGLASRRPHPLCPKETAYCLTKNGLSAAEGIIGVKLV